jgi:hypothetical protein
MDMLGRYYAGSRRSSYHRAVPPILVLALALALAGGPVSIPLAPGRTTTVQLPPPAEMGTPVERAVAGRFFGQAVLLDGQQRWAEAAGLYQQAVVEWSMAQRSAPSPALERAVQKAERERQRSQLLAAAFPQRRRADAIVTSMQPLELGRLLRAKVMVVRAATGVAPPALYARARRALEEALRLPGSGQRPGTDTEIHLLLCATHAAAGERTAARLALAHVSDADRKDPDNALALALCAAGLGEHELAVGLLEIFALRPSPHQADLYMLREIYVANDWDRLRGQPRFESLFR